jgi:hypothetical protein
MSGIVWIIYIAIIVAIIAGWWMIFTKAGEDGWKSIIPIWNLLIILKIIGREWWRPRKTPALGLSTVR